MAVSDWELFLALMGTAEFYKFSQMAGGSPTVFGISTPVDIQD